VFCLFGSECEENDSWGPLVVHAHKVYTLKVFALFCDLKEESEFYRAIEVVQGKHYVAEHYDLNRVQRWCKGKYEVEVVERGGSTSASVAYLSISVYHAVTY